MPHAAPPAEATRWSASASARTLDPRDAFRDSARSVLLVIDNYDSFTFNLVQYFGQLGVTMRVFRNDELGADEALQLNPDRVLISPGPCTPSEAGVSIDIIRAFAGRKPILGVCLGHQAMGQHFGGKVVRAGRLMHGKMSPINHHGTDIFKGLPSPFQATRYHSLLVERQSFPDCLEITAETAEGEIMGLRHREFPVWGVQFHPESIATEHGMTMLKNFLALN
jgi:anthranilate synthase/aminodeoxychorismate synthase-like glutamine amidotransferase